MARAWSEIRAKVRAAVLKDVLTVDQTTADYRWSDDELLIGVQFALAQFAAHTAYAAATSFTPATGTVYSLPPDVYDGDNTEQTLSVYLAEGTTTTTVTYLDPVRYTPGINPRGGSQGYYVFPDDSLNIIQGSSKEASSLNLHYFAYWPEPVLGTDLVLVPRWAEMVICYLTGGHVLSGNGLKTANIRQWNAKPDTGSPEDNPIRLQQQWFFKLANQLLMDHPVQDRVQVFRTLREQLKG